MVLIFLKVGVRVEVGEWGFLVIFGKSEAVDLEKCERKVKSKRSLEKRA